VSAFRLAKYYSQSPKAFLDLPLSELALQLAFTTRMIELGKDETE
jgi:hypothetical protein